MIPGVSLKKGDGVFVLGCHAMNSEWLKIRWREGRNHVRPPAARRPPSDLFIAGQRMWQNLCRLC